MSLELCILASGSSGNSSVVRTPNGVMLIDAGIGPRMCAKRLGGTGISIADIRAIVLTHLDSDHCNLRWAKTIVAQQNFRRASSKGVVLGIDLRGTINGSLAAGLQ